VNGAPPSSADISAIAVVIGQASHRFERAQRRYLNDFEAGRVLISPADIWYMDWKPPKVRGPIDLFQVPNLLCMMKG
jgi:hypothetical protein